MYGYCVLLMKMMFLCFIVCVVFVCGIVGVFVVCVLLLLNFMFGVEVMIVGEVVVGFINGVVFDCVWVFGTSFERAATFVLLVCGLVLSFFFILGFCEFLSLFYEEMMVCYLLLLLLDVLVIDVLNKLLFWRRA